MPGKTSFVYSAIYPRDSAAAADSYKVWPAAATSYQMLPLVTNCLKMWPYVARCLNWRPAGWPSGSTSRSPSRRSGSRSRRPQTTRSTRSTRSVTVIHSSRVVSIPQNLELWIFLTPFVKWGIVMFFFDFLSISIPVRQISCQKLTMNQNQDPSGLESTQL